MRKQIIINQAGPLPIENTIKTPGDTAVVFEFSGSCFSNKENEMIGFNLEIDGTAVSQSIIFANSPMMHLATVSKTFIINLDPHDFKPGEHTFRLTAMEGTSTDHNDWFSLTMDY